MEFEIKVEQVFECLACNRVDCTLANIREHCVQQLTEQCRTYVCHAVCPSHVW